MHELTHVFTGLNTYINTPNGPVTELMKLAGVNPKSPLLFLPKPKLKIPPESTMNLADGDYGEQHLQSFLARL